MASKTEADTRIDQYLADLATIVDQVSSEQPHGEHRQAARQLVRMVETLAHMPEEVTSDTEAMDYITSTLTSWAESLEPASVMTWDRDTAKAKLTWLGAERLLGTFSAAQSAEYDRLVVAVAPILSGKRSSGGGTGRGRGAPAPSIEGHPPVVTLSYGETVVSSKLRGDAANSLSNIMATAKRYAEKNGVPVPDDSVKEAFADVVNGERDQTDVNGWGLYAGER